MRELERRSKEAGCAENKVEKESMDQYEEGSGADNSLDETFLLSGECTVMKKWSIFPGREGTGWDGMGLSRKIALPSEHIIRYVQFTPIPMNSKN